MKISILVITYNHAAYIAKALEGLLMQRDLVDFEIIVCDDFSTDRTVSIAGEILASSQNTSFYINEKNLGITKNYQQAFARCRGEYICILEGDDYWIDPFKVKKQVNFLDNHPECSMCSHPFIVQKDVREIFTFPTTTDDTRYLLFTGKDLILDEGITLLKKPYALEEMLTTVRGVLERKRT
jgi:glycosyltransferase involved in cell wall biosynthesis